MLPGGSQRGWVTAQFLQGHLRNQRLPAALPVLQEEKGPCSLPSAPLFFSPSLSRFLCVSELSVMRLTCWQQNTAFTRKSSRKHLKTKMIFCQVYQPGKGKCLSENWSFRLSRYDDTRHLSSMAFTEPPSASLQY